MRIQGIRIEIVILALLVALAAFFGGQYLIREYWIGQPLQEELLEIPGVESAELIDGREGLILQVELGVLSNFLRTYQEILETGEGLLKNEEFRIEIKKDHGDLEDIFYQLHYHLYQYTAREDYLSLKEYLEREGERLGLNEARFFLDNTHLYLQLILGEDSYYHIIPRNRREEPWK